MKNLFSTLLVVVILGGSAVGALLMYQGAFKKVEVEEGPGPREATREIATRLLVPFSQAWANRDVGVLKALTPNEFGGGLPVTIEWENTTLPPFELKERATLDEVKRKSTTDFDEFFGYLLEQTYGLDHVQTMYSISDVEPYSDKLPDSWTFKLKLGVNGINGQGGVVSYRSQQTMIVVIPGEGSIHSAAYRSWDFLGEKIYRTEEPVVDQVVSVLAQNGVDADRSAIESMDVADFDNDGDVDIALQIKGGRRFVLARDGDSFEDVTKTVGIPTDVENQTPSSLQRTIWFDLNGDGFPDLISGVRVFQNQAGTHFEEITGNADVNALMGPAGVNSISALSELLELN